MYFKRAVTDKDEEPDTDLRVLEVVKANYGPVGETVMLRWRDGLFLPVEGIGSLDRMAQHQAADDVFLDLLAQFEGQGRNVSDKPTAPSFAPAMFCREPAAKGMRKDALAGAMRRLFAANRIHVGHYGRPSRLSSKLVIGPSPTAQEASSGWQGVQPVPAARGL
jgi:RecA-family ATPase